MYVVEYTQLYKQATAVQPGVKKLCWQVTIHLQVVGFAFRAPLIAQPRYQQGESNSRAGGPSKRFTGPIRLPKKNLLAWVSRIFEAAKKRFILQLGRGKQARKPEKYLRFSRENRLLFLKNPGKMEGGHWATRVPDVLLHHTQGCPCTCTGEASSLMRRWSPSLWTWKCLNMLGKWQGTLSCMIKSGELCGH